MAIDDLWYKNAVIYCLDVETFQDVSGDGRAHLILATFSATDEAGRRTVT